MARQLVVLALVLAAVLGLASAQAPASSPAAFSAGAGAASSPVDDNTIGAIDDAPVTGEDAVEAPVGGPVPEGAFPPTLDGPAQAPSAGSGAVAKVSAVAAVAAVAGYFF
ncbi:classical arabinogalactan protein 11-like [Rhodamnia argentea]|uniref:Classical arabinogalactan protein 11-like n=1 Tax=Rhodamnia argentea TaxID=178133 RepID=A0A8B8N5M8_9MYRT|nr:classical arabinogalactan protein 11-like [Rhodamnia argentea]